MAEDFTGQYLDRTGLVAELWDTLTHGEIAVTEVDETPQAAAGAVFAVVTVRWRGHLYELSIVEKESADRG